MDLDKLQNMKYADLQKLAKEIGIKANMKSDKLLQALIRFELKKSCKVEGAHNQNLLSQDSKEVSSLEESTDGKISPEIPNRMVTMGRGGKKRKKLVSPERELGSPVKKISRISLTRSTRKSIFREPLPLPSCNRKPTQFFPNLSPSPIKRRLKAVKTIEKTVITPIKEGLSSPVKKMPRPSLTRPIRKSISRESVPLPNCNRKPAQFFQNLMSPSPIKRRSRAVKTIEKTVITPIKEEILPEISEKSSNSKPRKRHSTFDKDVSDFLQSPEIVPCIETPDEDIEFKQSSDVCNSVKNNLETLKMTLTTMKNRRSTFTRNQFSTPENKSPEFDVTKENLNVNELGKSDSDESKSDAEKVSQIPRFISFMGQKATIEKKRSGTPNWEKIHKRNFDKMESIDEYLMKKRKRTETLSHTIKSANQVVEEVRSAIDRLKARQTPKRRSSKNRISFGAIKSPHQGVPFVPTVTSTRHLNLNFSTTKCSSQPNCPTPKFFLKNNAGVKKQTINVLKTSKLNTSIDQQTSVFRFSGNSLISPKKKFSFDLQASLQKKLKYKPYTGRLKPMTPSVINSFNHSNIKIKEPNLRTRENCREALRTTRETKKFNNQMARRGIDLYS